jgi:hypothetical protein
MYHVYRTSNLNEHVSDELQVPKTEVQQQESNFVLDGSCNSYELSI